MRQIFLLVFFLCGLAAITPARAESRTIHQEQSLYRNIFVTEDGDERCMMFRAREGLGANPCMLMSTPDKLVFEYAPMMLSSLFVKPAPQRILIIGLGGGTLPTALQKMLPAAQIDVVELDDAVYRIAQRFFNFKTGPKTRVFVEDGRVFVKRMGRQKARYDLIMLDAFEADYIPEHLLTREFLQEVRAIMAPDAVLAANTFSTSALYDHESATYQAVFGTFFNLKVGNRIILAKTGALPPFDGLRDNSKIWDAALRVRGADPAYLLSLFDTKVDWDPKARLLTDQYSPSNVLNTLPRGY